MLGTLSPIVHQYDNRFYRVPLRKEGDSYTMYVADKFTRVFDEKTLPDVVKTNMAMILARGDPIIHDHEVTQLSLMSMPVNSELRHIGWRVSDSWFCIILRFASLMELRGE